MRIGTVNVRACGDSARLLALWEAMQRARCDVVVFSEFRANRAAADLMKDLQAASYRCSPASDPDPRYGRGVLIASRLPFRLGQVPSSAAWVRVDFDTLTLYGVYFAPKRGGAAAFFGPLADLARAHNEAHERALAIGDFNAGSDLLDSEPKKPRPRFTGKGQYFAFTAIWPDAWRTLHPNTDEFSWFSKGWRTGKRCGWRIDHVFASPALLPEVVSATYDDGMRSSGLTDHSALVVEVRDRGSAQKL